MSVRQTPIFPNLFYRHYFTIKPVTETWNRNIACSYITLNCFFSKRDFHVDREFQNQSQVHQLQDGSRSQIYNVLLLPYLKYTLRIQAVTDFLEFFGPAQINKNLISFRSQDFVSKETK